MEYGAQSVIQDGMMLMPMQCVGSYNMQVFTYYSSDNFTCIQMVCRFMILILGLELPHYIYIVLTVITPLVSKVVLRLGIHIPILIVITTKKQE